jgi:hypothetical protein
MRPRRSGARPRLQRAAGILASLFRAGAGKDLLPGQAASLTKNIMRSCSVIVNASLAEWRRVSACNELQEFSSGAVSH